MPPQIIGIAAGGVVALVLVAVFATRAIRKSQRSARRRRSGLQAWTDRRSTLHGGADGDDDFFDPAAGAGAGGAVGAGANREKPWEMEMTPSREKLDYYGQPAGGAAGYAQGQAAYHEPRDGYASPSSAQPLVPYLTAGAYAQPQHPGMAAAYTGYPLPPVSQPVHQQYQPVQARSPSPVSPYNAPQTQGYPAAHNSFAQEMPPASGADGVPAVTLSAPQGQAGQAADEASPSVLRDGMWTVAKATFQRNLDDELRESCRFSANVPADVRARLPSSYPDQRPPPYRPSIRRRLVSLRGLVTRSWIRPTILPCPRRRLQPGLGGFFPPDHLGPAADALPRAAHADDARHPAQPGVVERPD